jgi:hypothetical protein
MTAYLATLYTGWAVQYQLGSIDAGCQANSADSRGEEGQPFIMRAH